MTSKKHMIDLVKKYKLTLILFVLICFCYLVLRLPNLTSQPIFADEAIYIRWAQIMKAEPTLRFLPQSDGKTPLYMWALMPLFKVFSDPLFAGRFLSVLAGIGTLSGAFFLGWRFFNWRVGLWSALLMAIVPYMVFFDRMALVDSMLAAFTLWSLIFALLLIKSSRLDLAMILGFLLGGGILTKTPGFFNFLALPVTLAVFNWQDKLRDKKLVRIALLWLVSLVIAYGMYNILRLGPQFDNLSSRNQDYVHSPLRVFQYPTDPLIPHLRDLGEWLPILMTWPVLLLVVFGVVLGIIRGNRDIFTILLWLSVPLMAQILLLKTFTARYLLFSIPPLLCVAGWGIDQLLDLMKRNNFRGAALTLIIILPLPLIFIKTLLTNPLEINLPREEKNGYFEDWTAGYGMSEIARFFIEQSKQGTIVVGTEGSFGTLPDGLTIYLDKYFHQAPKDKQVIVIGGEATISAQIRNAALDRPTYFISNKSRFNEVSSTVKLIREFPKVVGESKPYDAILLFQVLPGE